MNKPKSYIRLPIEYAFIIIAMIFGIGFVYINPPFHSNDEDRHFYGAYFLSEGQIGPIQQGNKIGGYLPEEILNTANMFQKIRFSNGEKINRAKLAELKRSTIDESRTVFYNNSNYTINPVAYIPHAIGIILTKGISFNAIYLNYGARISSLLVYILLSFIALRIMPVHKHILFLIALNPMSLYQAASVTYDMLTNACAFLLIALSMKFAFQSREISWKSVVLFLSIAVLLRWCKDGYLFIPFLLFLIPLKSIGSKGKILVISVALTGSYFIPNLLWQWYLRSLHLTGGIVFITDFLYDANTQLSVILADPITFIQHFFMNFLAQGKMWIKGTLGRFGNSYTLLNEEVLFIHGAVLIVFSMLDRTRGFVISTYQRVVLATVAIGTICFLVLGFYLVFSPVGASVVFGFQGRYFIPILPVLLLFNYNTSIRSAFWDRWKDVIVISYSSLLLIYTLIFINGYFYQ